MSATFTAAEVAKHNTENDCWVIIEGKVLDVTKFLPDHPGGKKTILDHAGKDATEVFDSIHPKGTIAKALPPSAILGTVATAGGAAAGPKFVVPESSFIQPVASEEQSLHSGGTAGILPKERKNASFDIELMTNVIDGGAEKTKKRRFILSPSIGSDFLHRHNLSRVDYFKESIEHFYGIHDKYTKTYVPSKDELIWMSENAISNGTMGNHYAIFFSTILGQGSVQQVREMSEMAIRGRITGAYAQTEIGHGSNVRGLQTTATYDAARQEFILTTPTLQSIKWWPGTLGKVATHCVCYAQLNMEGKDLGLHAFLMQIRDENHKLLPGVQTGDLGPKLGDGANDTGFMILKGVRVPRTAMLSKNQWVDENGKYVVSPDKKKNSKLTYATMMFTRGILVRTSAGRLAIAATIAARYSAVRHQGFQNTRSKDPKSPERAVIDYQVQRYRVLRQVAFVYALKFTGQWMTGEFEKLSGGALGAEVSPTESKHFLEIFAMSAALKAFVTVRCLEGMEDMRKCCGGNGYLLNSGVSQLPADFMMNVAAEGDYIVMMLQAGRFLLKVLQDVRNGKEPYWLCDYLKPVGSVLFLCGRGNPSRKTSVEAFMDPEYLLQIHQHRARTHVVEAGLAFAAQKGKPRDAAWDASALQLVTAVQSHCSVMILRLFMVRVEAVRKESATNKNLLPVVAALTNVAALYGLNVIIDENFAGIVDAKQIAAAKAAAIRIGNVLRRDVVPLVDAFDIPDRVLCSTLGRHDGNVYEALYTEALKSALNQHEPFVGYEETLAPRLDKEYLRKGAEAFRARNAKL